MNKQSNMFLAIRKTSYAKTRIVPGEGKIFINGRDLNSMDNILFKYEVMEPLFIAGDVAKKYNFLVETRGGGNFSRCRAIRSSIAKALVSIDSSLKEKFVKIDRTLLVDDRRITEPQKPYRSAARARKQTSYR
ncbi:MAG: 30S ribosomal protein S9 [Candidatus Rehaiarchaeum fermentans]|nr:30S ribosomal protein S9 [Candidatus Rehaiarchaeum fermentans]